MNSMTLTHSVVAVEDDSKGWKLVPATEVSPLSAQPLIDQVSNLTAIADPFPTHPHCSLSSPVVCVRCPV